MSANTETIPATAEDFAKFTRVQKLAVFLIMIGHDSAAQILKSLNEHELDSVTAEMAKFTTVSQEIQQEILREFTEVAISAGTALRGGVEYAQAALEKAVGIFKATNVVSRNSTARAPIPAMKQIIELEPRQIFNLLKNEQPQTIALIVSYLEPEKAAPLLKLFRPELRDLVVERLATLAPTPVEIIERIVEVLVQKLGTGHVRALNQTGGLKSAANVLNAIDKNLSKSLLTSLEERNPDLGRAIRQKMFTFDDIVTLEASAIQRILREVDMRDLALSLKNAGEKLKSLLLGSISKRAAETVKEEMELLGSAKARDIEAAQLRIIDIMRRLEAEGEIELGDSKETTDAVMA